MNETHEWLRKGVLDLAIMLRGMDADLDSALEELKVALKNREELDLEEFQGALEKTDERFDQIDRAAEQGTRKLYSLYQGLINLDESAVPEQFHNQVENNSQYLFEALNLLDSALPLVTNAAPDNPDTESTDTENTDGEDEDSLKRLRQKLCSRFITMLRTLAILGDESGELKSLAQKLEAIPDWNELDTLAGDAISLIQQRLNAEKGQFEIYLNQLNKKLRVINDMISDDKNSVEALNKQGETLELEVDGQVSRARQEIQEAASIEELRKTLNLSLDGLMTMLDDFQQQNRGDLAAMSERRNDLNQKVKELQADNRRLMKQVAQERKLSMRDPLTHLPNRQGFEQRLKEELARSNRYQQPLSIAMLDIDFFKRVNDQFGHLAGDKVLKILAKEMRGQMRESDYLARFGGEEFILILPQTDCNDALTAVEKIRQHIAQCPFHFQGKPVKVTLSAGLAEYKYEESRDQWLNRADIALYKSKNDGRDRTSLAADA